VELVTVLRGLCKLRFRDFPPGDFGGESFGGNVEGRAIEEMEERAGKERR